MRPSRETSTRRNGSTRAPGGASGTTCCSRARRSARAARLAPRARLEAGASVSGYDAMATIIPVLAELSAAGRRLVGARLPRRPAGRDEGARRDRALSRCSPGSPRLGWGATGVYNASAFVVQALLGVLRRAGGRRPGGAPGPTPARLDGAAIGLVLVGVRAGARMAARLRTPHARGRAAALRGGPRARRRGLAADPVGRRSALRGRAGARRSACSSPATSWSSTASSSAGRSCSASGGRSAGGRPGARCPSARARSPCCSALPSLLPVLAHARSTDSPRALGRTQITYSYLVERPVDLAGVGPLDARRDPRRPAGAASSRDERAARARCWRCWRSCPWRRARGLGSGSRERAPGASSSARTRGRSRRRCSPLIPPLGSFRVPTRALLPVRARPAGRRAGGRVDPRGTLDSACEPRSPALVRSRSSVLPGCRARSRAGRSRSRWSSAPRAAASSRACRPPASLCALAAGGLGRVPGAAAPVPRARRASSRTRGAWDAPEARAAGAAPAAHARQPGLGGRRRSGRTRRSRRACRRSTATTSRRGGTSRCSRALHGYEYQPNALLLRFPACEKWTRPIFALYNVGWFLQRTEATPAAGPQAGARRPAPPGSARGFETVPSFAALGRSLLDADRRRAERARARLWLVDVRSAHRAGARLRGRSRLRQRARAGRERDTPPAPGCACRSRRRPSARWRSR